MRRGALLPSIAATSPGRRCNAPSAPIVSTASLAAACAMTSRSYGVKRDGGVTNDAGGLINLRSAGTLSPRVASWSGSSSMRTAYFCAPKTDTCATPSTIDSRCAIVVSAYSSRAESDRSFDVSAKNRIGAAAGFCFL